MSWLAADVLVAVVDLDSGGPTDASVSVTIDGSPVAAASRSESLPRAGTDFHGAIFTIWLEASHLDSTQLELGFEAGSGEVSLGPAPASALGVDLRTLVRENLAGLDPVTRERMIGFLLAASNGDWSTVDPNGLSESLCLVRDALRDPHPRIAVRPEAPHALHVDDLFRVDERTFFVHGWMRSATPPVVRLTAVSPEGARVAMLERLARVRRPDVDKLFASSNGSEKLGFVCSLPLHVPSRAPGAWIFELEDATGDVAEVAAPDAVSDRVAARDAIVSMLGTERSPKSPLTEHVLPAVARLQEQLASTVEVEHVERFGDAPGSPEVSIVVPLYKRIDLLQHQLAQFAADPELANSDLIYVLDSPELSEATLADAARLFELYRVPFRIATVSRNGGFAVANNLGASLAVGRLLLLLNSDVLPTAPGWLGRLAALHDSAPRIGALGPKLLFEDGSLQHAGLYFRRSAPWAAWENAHYFKGLHGDLPAANVPRTVPAVTAACLMLKRDLYEELDGLRSIYIQGDYEDSDLCLRLREAGHEIWYRPEVALYHLEGRSYATATRQANARYNTWLHTSLWDQRIEQLMSERDRIGHASTLPTG